MKPIPVRFGVLALLSLLGVLPAVRVAAQQPSGPEAGYALLADLVRLVNQAAMGGLDAEAASTGVVGLAKQLKGAQEGKRVDPLFALRYSRLLAGLRQALLADPELLYWPMYRHSMVDFIEERTGRMPDWDKLLFVVNDHGGSGVGLAVLVEAVMSEVVSLHIHLETLAKRPEILRHYMEAAQPARK